MRRSTAWVVGLACVALALVAWLARGGAGSHERDAFPRVAEGSGTGAARAGAATGAIARVSRVSGRVTRAQDGAGLAATVTVARVGVLYVAGPPELVDTDATGAWSVALAPGAYRASASALGYLPGSAAAVAGGDHGADHVDVALAPGGITQRGRVTDAGGGPVAGAVVVVARFDDGDARAGTRTAPDGTFALTLAERRYRFTVMHPDYATETRDADIVDPPVSADFVLTPGGAIRGTIVARATGEPIAGLVVDASGPASPAETQAVSDERGAFELRGLAAGAYRVTALGPGYICDPETIAEVGVGQTRDGVRLVADAAFAIRGRFVRADDPTRGVAGVEGDALAYRTVGSSYAAALAASGPDGAFELFGARPGRYQLHAIGHARGKGDEVTVVERDVEGVVVAIDAPLSLGGRIEPPVAARVTAGRATAEIDPSGRFHLDGVEREVHSLEVASADGRGGSLALDAPPRDRADLVVHLEARASIAGRVVDAAGAPIGGATVEVVAAEGGGFAFRGPRVTAAADGTWHLGSLTAGRYRARASDAPHAWDAQSLAEIALAIADVTVAAGGPRAEVTLTLPVRDAAIRGHVFGTDGRPVADARVTAAFGDGGSPDGAPAMTGSDGRFAIERLRAGEYQVTAESSSGGDRVVRAAHTGDEVELRLVQLGTLTVRVTSGGVPVATYELRCGDRHRPVEDPLGTVVLDHLPAGPRACVAVSRAGTATGDVTIGAGSATLDLAIGPWATVAGTAIDVVSRRPVQGLAVAVFPRGDSPYLITEIDSDSAVTDASGHFEQRVAGSSGTLDLMTRSMGLTLGGASYMVAPGERRDVGILLVIPAPVGPLGTLGLRATHAPSPIIDSVEAGGPAAAAGLVAGDVVTAIDGHPVADLAPRAASLLEAVAVGQRVTLTLARGVTVSVIAQ